MKIVVLMARTLLGLIFVVFGLHPFLKYIPMQMGPGTAGKLDAAGVSDPTAKIMKNKWNEQPGQLPRALGR